MKNCNCKASIQVETNVEETSIKIAGHSVAICVGTIQLVEGLFQSLKKEDLDIFAEKLVDVIEEYKERA